MLQNGLLLCLDDEDLQFKNLIVELLNLLNFDTNNELSFEKLG
jgi:hypothetical protein